jgi:hypothetical protein
MADAMVVDARPDAAPEDAYLADAILDAHPVDAALDVMAPDAAPDMPIGECIPGERACTGEREFRACTDDALWRMGRCADDELCLDGACRPDPAQCVAGSRTCNGPRSPGECVPGEGYRDLEPCPEGTVCIGDGRCVSPECATAEGERSYLGCDYFVHDLLNNAYDPASTPDAPLGVVISNATDRQIHVTVTQADEALATLVGEVRVRPSPFGEALRTVTVASAVLDADGMVVARGFEQADRLEVPIGGMAILLLPTHPQRAASYVAPHAWRIRTDQPVAAYQFGPYCCNYSASNDASLLLPVPALGDRYHFLGVPTWGFEDFAEDATDRRIISFSGTLTVIGTAPNTQVEVTLPPGAEVRPSDDPRLVIEGNRATATIDAYEVLTLQSQDARFVDDQIVGVDLSGAAIVANRSVAVFSGHVCSFYPQSQGACDHLEEQLIPDDTWGVRYLLTPGLNRAYWKLMAQRDDTRITFSQPFDALRPAPPGFLEVPDCAHFRVDAQTIVLDAGQHCEFGTQEAVQISATQPVLAMGVLVGQEPAAEGFPNRSGDPSIFIVPPVAQFRTAYTFLAPSTYFGDILLAQVPMDAELRLDGQPVDLGDAVVIAGSPYRYVRIPIEDGAHRVESDRPFGIVVYAYDDYVSYAFAGGLNLKRR